MTGLVTIKRYEYQGETNQNEEYEKRVNFLVGSFKVLIRRNKRVVSTTIQGKTVKEKWIRLYLFFNDGTTYYKGFVHVNRLGHWHEGRWEKQTSNGAWRHIEREKIGDLLDQIEAAYKQPEIKLQEANQTLEALDTEIAELEELLGLYRGWRKQVALEKKALERKLNP